MTTDLKLVQLEENEINFSVFNNQTIVKLGTYLIDYFNTQNISAGFKIFVNGKTVFQYMSPYTTPDHEKWLNRKINTVLHFQSSTLYLNIKLQNNQQLLKDKYGLDLCQYTIVPGGFPIKVKDYGFIGAMAISGLDPLQDHKLLVDCLKEML